MTPLAWALLSRAKKEVLRIINSFHGKGQQMFFSQGWLAGRVGVTRETINRIMAWLAENGFIKSIRHSRFCVYVLVNRNLTSVITPKITSPATAPYCVNYVREEAPPEDTEARKRAEFDRMEREAATPALRRLAQNLRIRAGFAS